MKILVAGGNGGIGWAIVQEIGRRFPTAEVHATYRRQKPDVHQSGVIWHQVDVSDESQIRSLSESVCEVDWVINCIGMLHIKDKGPEKNLSSLDAEFFFNRSRLIPCQLCCWQGISLLP